MVPAVAFGFGYLLLTPHCQVTASAAWDVAADAWANMSGHMAPVLTLHGRAGCAASHKRERVTISGYGYMVDELGLSNTTTWVEVAQRLEELAPGLVAGIAIGSTALVCCLLVCVLALRMRLLKMRAQFEERLRLVTVQTELDAFDESGGVPTGLDAAPTDGGIVVSKRRTARNGKRNGRLRLGDDDDL